MKVWKKILKLVEGITENLDGKEFIVVKNTESVERNTYFVERFTENRREVLGQIVSLISHIDAAY